MTDSEKTTPKSEAGVAQKIPQPSHPQGRTRTSPPRRIEVFAHKMAVYVAIRHAKTAA